MLERTLNFFQNTLDGTVYYIVAAVSVILIITIIILLVKDRKKANTENTVVPTENLEPITNDNVFNNEDPFAKPVDTAPKNDVIDFSSTTSEDQNDKNETI